MNQYVKDIAKSTALLFVVGVALALITGPLAHSVNLFETIEVPKIIAANTPLWTGVFFGAFGGLRAAFDPLINRVFGDVKAPESPTRELCIESPALAVHIEPEPEQCQTCFQDKVKESLLHNIPHR